MVLVWIGCWCGITAASATDLDVVGATVLRTLVTNLDGTGVVVLQPEAGEAGFLICTGSPTDGFSFHGPFADDEGAKSWAEGEADDNWWMVSVGAVQA